MLYFLVILIGYLLGSVSPAYFLGRLLKKKDIRQIGDGNAGTTNVYKTLGLTPAIVCATYDLGKGLLAIYIATLFGAPLLAIYLAGYAAVIGHVFPFYLGFRGGQGSATAVGILIYLLIVLLERKMIPLDSLAVLAAVVLVILAITKQKGFLAFIVLPSLAFLIFKNYQFDLTSAFAGLLLAQLFAVNLYGAIRFKIFALKEKTKENMLVWRSIARPVASVIPIAYFYVDKDLVLGVVGSIAGLFLILDLVRLLSGRVNLFFFRKAQFVFKKREEKRFSSITLFLLSTFVTILLFPKSIAIIAILFLVFGDVFAKFFGLEYGRIKIFDKSFEGSLAHLSICLLVGYLAYPYLGLPALTIVVGALAATLAELIPMGINDNFIVPIASAVAMLLSAFVV